MGKLEATPAMREGVTVQAQRKADERPDVADYEARADERRSARLEAERKRREAFLASAEGQAAMGRLDAMRRAGEALRSSTRYADIDTFTAAVRGIEIERGQVRILAPNAYVARLYAPGNGKGGLLKREQVAAAADYAALSDQLKVGGASRDPADIRVDGGGAGCTELAVLNRMDAADRFRRARTALEHASIVPEWGRVIRRLTDWIVLDGGHPMEDFDLGSLPHGRGVKSEMACKAMLLAQGLGTLCQHFERG